MTGRNRRRNRAHPVTGRYRRWAAISMVVFVTVTALPVLALRWLQPPASSVMLQRAVSEHHRQYFNWVDLEQISPHVALAVVAAEDQLFPKHTGFDLHAIRNAIGHNARGGRLRGASTLSQQVARNLFLWQGRSYLRKGLEAWFTLLLEVFWSKQRILEVYLNIAETGPQTFGVEAAARRFLHTNAARLDREQAALLAAVLPAPHRMHLDAPSDYVRSRQQHILRQMQQLGDGYLGAILHPGNT